MSKLFALVRRGRGRAVPRPVLPKSHLASVRIIDASRNQHVSVEFVKTLAASGISDSGLLSKIQQDASQTATH